MKLLDDFIACAHTYVCMYVRTYVCMLQGMRMVISVVIALLPPLPSPPLPSPLLSSLQMGQTAIHAAVQSQSTSCLRILLTRLRAHHSESTVARLLCAQDHNGQSVVHYAAGSGAKVWGKRVGGGAAEPRVCVCVRGVFELQLLRKVSLFASQLITNRTQHCCRHVLRSYSHLLNWIWN